MPNEPQRPVTPAWKKDVKKDDRKSKGKYEWQKEAPAAPRVPGLWARRSKLITGAVGLVVATALLVWVIRWLFPPKPAYLLLVGTDYVLGNNAEANLAIPPNVYGWSGFKDFQAQLDKLADVQEPRRFGLNSDWEKGMDSAANDSIILFLSVHGGADHNGPYLLPHDADTGDETKRVRFTQVLERLETVPQKKNKVLILDVTQVSSDWSLGMLHNDFARALQEAALKERIVSIPNLVVLCASDVNQRSWVSEEWRQTIFAHYVLEGLRGAADGAGGGRPNGRVDARELYVYVRDNVKNWVYANRDEALQTPFLLPDEERAQKIALTAPRDEYQEADPQEAPGYKKTADLARVYEEWKACQDLATRIPEPWVYAPHLWRQYLDTLLLYENVVRANGDKAEDLKRELDGLKSRIQEARGLKLDSVQNAVSMPAALGFPLPWSKEEANKQFRALWEAGDDKREPLLKSMLENDRDNKKLQLSGLLLEQPPDRQTLTRANEFLPGLGAGHNNQRAAEVHLLALLARDLAEKQPPNALLAQALRVRRLGEDTALGVYADPAKPAEALAHPYSEYVFPWIQEKVKHADKLRGDGEDYLFASDQKSWDEAARLLAQAEKEYGEAQRDAQLVRDALRTCQKTLALLPYYSRWAAQRRDSEKELTDLIETLWKETHYLARVLESAKPEDLDRDIAIDARDSKLKLRERAQNVRKHFEEIEGRFLQKYQDIPNNPNVNLPSVLREIEEGLVVPAIDAELRKGLLETARRISRQFHLSTAVAGKIPEASEEVKDKSRKLALDGALRQGRLALAALGERWFDDPLFQQYETFSRVQDSLDRAPQADENWSKPLIQAGDQIGRRWRAFPDKINAQTTDARTVDLGRAREDLKEAERLARQVDGAGAKLLSANPVGESRQVRVHDLLLWQAERTYTAHWFGEDEEQPYYQYAGNLYVRDAENRVKGRTNELTTQQSEARLRDVRRLAGKLEKVTRLQPKLLNPQARDVTTEPVVSLEYRLAPEPKDSWLPEGFPVVWAEAGKFLQLRDEPGRRPAHTDGKQPTALPPLAFKPLPDPAHAKKLDATALTLHMIYRGQRIDAPTAINLYRAPDIISYQNTTPRRGGIAVQANKAILAKFAPQNGAIAIVLDCSGSMFEKYEEYRNAGKPYRGDTPCKYHQATKALEKMLKDLPKGTKVSVTIFSQAIGRRNKNWFPIDKQPLDPEETIKLIREPAPWDPTQQLDDLIKKLEEYTPFNETPLVRAMTMAKEQGFPENFHGFKTMIVLTDGEDNRFKGDTDLHQRHNTTEITKYMEEEFRNSGIALNLVGFRVPDNEEQQRLTEQFKDVIEKKLPLRGKFFTVDNPEELAAILRKSMQQQLRFTLDRAGDERPLPIMMPEGGWTVSQDTGQEQWALPLAAGDYVVRVQTNRPLRKDLHLDNGDFLLVSLTADGLDFERVLFGERFRATKPHKDDKPDCLLTIPHYQSNPLNGSLDLMVTLENPRAEAERKGQLHVIHPRTVWFEVKSPDGQRPDIIWGELPGYPAPTWSLHVSDWPVRQVGGEFARPELHAWYNWNEVHPGKAGMVEFKRGAELDSFKGKKQGSGKNVGDEVLVESVTIEEHEVRTTLGGKAEPRSCLVVRLSYPTQPKLKPVWVEPDSLAVPGVEHHFYSQAGKYTGYFWPVDKKKAEELLTGLRLYSLEEFQNLPSTQSVELKVDKAPDNQRRPEPITK